MIVKVLDVVIAGLVMGGIYTFAAIGLNLQYGVVRVLNMAHGDFIMVGAFASLLPLHRTRRESRSLALVICTPLLFALGPGCPLAGVQPHPGRVGLDVGL